MRATKLTAALAAVPLMLAGIAGTAMADDISNDLDTSVDATAEIMSLNVGGSNGSTQLYVVPLNGDGKNGCNLTGGTRLDLSVSSSDTGVATVSPSSVTFTSCGDTKTLTVTPVAQGSATVSVTQTANTTGGSFNLAPATFTVNVAPPANTAPSVTITGVSGGQSYAKDAVPTAMCEVTDAEDGNSSFAATLSPITGEYAEDGIGTQTATCEYTDDGGLKASASATYSIIDPTEPAISYTLDPATPDGAEDWYRSDVTLTWTVTEDESPSSLTKTGCVDQEISADQGETTYRCSATSAGGGAVEQSVTIKRDATAPIVTYGDLVSGDEGTNGWYTSDVTARFIGTDALSGPASASQTATTSGEGTAVELPSPAFTDAAGNTTPAGAVTKTFKIDKTAPATPTFEGWSGGEIYYGDVPAAPTCSSSDDGSGLASCVVTGGGTSAGEHEYVATATDNAGNVSTARLEYTVRSWRLQGFYAPVDMGSVWNTVKGGSTVPLKFEVFGAEELTSTATIEASFTAKAVACPSGSFVADPIEILSTGATSLRYDSTAGQFIQNWQTPKKAGACYEVSVTTGDGSKQTARFQLK
jgi:hypothetical protein